MVSPAVDRLIDPAGPGTAEARWRSARERRTVPPLDLAALSGPGRAVVVAPHPDDEVLGAGGLIRHLLRDGWTVEVVAVTDGEAAFGAPDPALAEERSREVAFALACLSVGLPGAPGARRLSVERLGVPDGRVGAHLDRLERTLAARLTGARLCVGPWPGDGHPDHEAAGRAAERAAAGLGVATVGYPVWLWHWGDPERDLPWERCRRLELGPDDREAKGRALAAFRSQSRPAGTGAILTAAVLAHFRRDHEMFVT